MNAGRGASTSIHGVLVSIGGVGVLMRGEAGAGKSVLALALLANGHRLIADDVVEIERLGTDIIGRAPDRFRALLVAREVGIIDIRQLVGEDAYAHEGRIDVCVELLKERVPRSAGPATPRTTDLLGVSIPAYVMSTTGQMQFDGRATLRQRVYATGAFVENEVFAAHDSLLARGRAAQAPHRFLNYA